MVTVLYDCHVYYHHHVPQFGGSGGGGLQPTITNAIISQRSTCGHLSRKSRLVYTLQV
jgi:hypothetical protein